MGKALKICENNLTAAVLINIHRSVYLSSHIFDNIGMYTLLYNFLHRRLNITQLRVLLRRVRY